MKEIKEIGLEKELWLLRNEEIIEPSLLNFPADIMGFLVEIRSLPSDRAYPVITTLYQEELQYQLRANKFGMRLTSEPYKIANKEFVQHIEETYKIREFPDYTRNIYYEEKLSKMTLEYDDANRLITDISRKSHHLGVFPETETASPLTKEVEMYRLTAGMHVHFSSRDAVSGIVLDLPIEEIVEKMDKKFADDIIRTKRIRGEFEMKPSHGFEYRSLPCDVDVVKVVKEAFKILRSV